MRHTTKFRVRGKVNTLRQRVKKINNVLELLGRAAGNAIRS
jgi:hypothetical protein